MTTNNPWQAPHPIPKEVVAAAAFYEQAPDASRPAYAVVPLSFNPHYQGFAFQPGDRVEAVLPADVLAACVERGEVTFDEPTVTK